MMLTLGFTTPKSASKSLHIRRGTNKPGQGFSLIELLVAVTILSLTLSAALRLLTTQLAVNRDLAIFEVLRKNWNQATSFIVSEAALSERLYTSSSSVSINSACGITASQFKLAMVIRLDLPPVVYGLLPSSSRLAGDNMIWRCGPTINDDGSYSSILTTGVIADGLHSSGAGSGFSVTATNDKRVDITLTLKGNNSNFYKLSTSAAARINPSFLYPNESSLCVAANNIADFVGNSGSQTATLSTAGLGCGGGGGDTITGTSGNDILEAGDTGSSRLTGQAGDDILRGTNSSDTLAGNADDDTLIGRNGNDSLSGGTGTNLYSPGTGTDTITGGSSLDILFLPGGQSSYTKSPSCSKTSCTFTSKSGNGTKSTTDVEIVIFSDSRLDL